MQLLVWLIVGGMWLRIQVGPDCVIYAECVNYVKYAICSEVFAMTILISRTDLARNTRKVIEDARRTGPVVVGSYGEQQAALMDIVDFRLLKAVAAWQPDPEAPFSNPEAVPAGLTLEEVERESPAMGRDVQVMWNRIMGEYLDGNISLGRAAVLLSMSRFELQDRLNRLDLPIRLGPQTIEEARQEFEVLKALRLK